MEHTDAIEKFKEYIEENYHAELLERVRKGRPRMVFDFKKLVQFDSDIGDFILDEPEEAMKCIEIACKEFDLPKDIRGLSIRFKNIPRSCKIPINKIRAENINQLIITEGMIKQKSDVKPVITSARFECQSCGTIIHVLQTDERKFLEPKVCGCKAGKFKVKTHELIDVFSMAVEEPVEFIQGGTKLTRLKVLCRKDLTESKIERQLYQGCRVEVTGILKSLQIMQGNTKTAKMDWYLDANYIKIYDETFENLSWDEKDVKKFEALAESDNWLQQLRQSIFYDVVGHDEECEAVILQMFGGVGKQRDGANKRGNFHILLVGDPGSAKSTLLKVAQQFCPKAIYTAGTGISGKGLTASVVKDELLGGYTLEAGAIVLANNGVLMIDEMDKVEGDFKNALHEPLSDETVSVNKANIQATLIARTAVLGAANPKYGSYSEFDSIYTQIDMPSTLINRFDLVYPIRESKLTEQDDYDIARKIVSRGAYNESIQQPFDREFVKKYVAYAKTIHPIVPEKIQIFLAEKYQSLKKAKKAGSEAGTVSLPITPRNIEGFLRVIEAVARSRLHKTIQPEDANLGYKKVLYSLSQLGIDPDSGDAFSKYTVEGVEVKTSYTKRDLLSRTRFLVHERTAGKKDELFDGEELREVLKGEGYGEIDIDDCIVKLEKDGEILQSKPNKYRVL